LSALRAALNHACDRQSVLVPVLAWHPVGGELAYRRAPCPELLRLWRQHAVERLAEAFDQALGGYPTEVEVQPEIIRGAAGAALVQTACGDGDLLVVGSGHRRLGQRRVSGPTTRYCLTHARCPVLLVPPPELLHRAAAARARAKLRITSRNRLDQVLGDATSTIPPQ
jgi:nucleotide-binding universal stress UspA family protein